MSFFSSKSKAQNPEYSFLMLTDRLHCSNNCCHEAVIRHRATAWCIRKVTEIHTSATKHKEDPRDSVDSLSEELQEKFNSLLLYSFEDLETRPQHNNETKENCLTMEALLGNDEFQNCLGGSSFPNIELAKVTSDTLEDNVVMIVMIP